VRIIIENETLRACIESKGAELVSLIHRPSGCEIIWQPESGQWQRRSPILFPIVGGQKNGYYTYDGRRYEMERHGFAMDREFCCETRGPFSAVFSMKDDFDTRVRYPFSFCLIVSYVLDQNTLQVVYSVENRSDCRMPYCTAAIPRIACHSFRGRNMTIIALSGKSGVPQRAQPPALHARRFAGLRCPSIGTSPPGNT
jgi:galactose mutarotase-like enzyme